MTRKLFWTDPYLTRLATRVTAVAGDEITVAETIFYALSGGQESDDGEIGGHPVLAARKAEREIYYRLPAGHGLAPGAEIVMTIDGARRHRLMRLHFAAEIVLELACRRLPLAEKIGAHIAADKARIDFAWPENVAPHLPALAADANRVVAADQAIVSAFSDEAAEQRYWQIPEFARVPCGGAHLRRTGEVGAITLRRRNIGKGKERIEIHVDDGPGRTDGR
jgi:Ser-tRNA(Ala) deacylase AlaX